MSTTTTFEQRAARGELLPLTEVDVGLIVEALTGYGMFLAEHAHDPEVPQAERDQAEAASFHALMLCLRLSAMPECDEEPER